MAKQNKKVTIEVDAATMKQLGRASDAISELAGAWMEKSDDGKQRARRTPAR